MFDWSAGISVFDEVRLCVCLAGWLLLEVRGNWIKQRRYWFVLGQDSLDYYSSPEKGARRLGTLVLTSLCSVIWPDKQTYKERGEGLRHLQDRLLMRRLTRAREASLSSLVESSQTRLDGVNSPHLPRAASQSLWFQKKAWEVFLGFLIFK